MRTAQATFDRMSSLSVEFLPSTSAIDSASRAGHLAHLGLDQERQARERPGVDRAAEVVERAHARLLGGGAQRPHAADADAEQAHA
jgi:hypothetical protein